MYVKAAMRDVTAPLLWQAVLIRNGGPAFIPARLATYQTNARILVSPPSLSVEKQE